MSPLTIVFKREERSWVLVTWPVILVTQKAEFRRIEVCSQPRQIVLKTNTKQGWWSGSSGKVPT
jgi:hypothetical protein